MSINKYQQHLLVLPEDDANRQIANGFILNPNLDSRAIQILPIAGGWRKVVDKFQTEYVPTMEKYPQRMFLLLIDFDGDEERLSYVKSRINEDLQKRVFVLGVLSEPENLRKNTGMSWEDIGKTLAKDCAEGTKELWEHDLLKHNQPELELMISSVKPYLFNRGKDH